MDDTKKTKNSFRQTADSLNQWSHVFSAGVASGNHFRVFWKRWFPELGIFLQSLGEENEGMNCGAGVSGVIILLTGRVFPAGYHHPG